MREGNMSGIPNTILAILKKLGYYVAQYGMTAYYWCAKLIKVQLHKWKKCGAKKQMDAAYSSLGAEVYSLHKHGEYNWQNMPSVQQQIKMVEETESKVFDVDEAVDEIDKEFQSKKEELREKYSALREVSGKTDFEE
jgi:hypothetical protein